MTEYHTKEKLLAIQLLGMARQSVGMYAKPCECKSVVQSVLNLAAAYARNGADLTVLKVLEYPDTTRANP